MGRVRHVQEGTRSTPARSTSAQLFGTKEDLKGNYLYRMAGAVLGIYGNTAAEAIYPNFSNDSAGAPLTGANNYTFRFASGQLPPVNAFWSLTMYEMPQSLLVANPINRYLINSPMLPSLVPDTDGGYTLLRPERVARPRTRRPTGCPRPKGPFVLVLRLYWPKPDALNGTWKAPQPGKGLTVAVLSKRRSGSLRRRRQRHRSGWCRSGTGRRRLCAAAHLGHVRRRSGRRGAGRGGAESPAVRRGQLEELAMNIDYRAVPRSGSRSSGCRVVGPAWGVLSGDGIYRGDALRDWVAERLAELRASRRSPTWRSTDRDLPPEQRYRLVVTVADVTLGQLIRLPWDYERVYGLDPDEQSVADAVRASTAIPFFFQPGDADQRRGPDVDPGRRRAAVELPDRLAGPHRRCPAPLADLRGDAAAQSARRQRRR